MSKFRVNGNLQEQVVDLLNFIRFKPGAARDFFHRNRAFSVKKVFFESLLSNLLDGPNQAGAFLKKRLDVHGSPVHGQPFLELIETFRKRRSRPGTSSDHARKAAAGQK